MKRIDPINLLIGLSVLLFLCVLIAILFGAVSLPVIDFFNGVATQQYQSIIFSIRLPRVLLAAVVGAILAVSGAAMQGLFRNPLADPSLIGVTAGASLGASLVIVFGGGLFSHWLGLPLIVIGAFVGGCLAVSLVYRLATTPYGTSVATMLLAGIGITAFAASITSLLEFIASNEMLRRISLWRMGGLDGADHVSVGLALIMALIAGVILPRYSQSLNALLLGESEARHLGIDVESLKRTLILLVAACVGVSVALAGNIAFVGLVVPHIVRLLIGPDHRFLLPAAALAGAALLVLADLLARLILAPAELPVGVITAFIGVPFFISLLKRRYIYGMG